MSIPPLPQSHHISTQNEAKFDFLRNDFLIHLLLFLF